LRGIKVGDSPPQRVGEAPVSPLRIALDAMAEMMLQQLASHLGQGRAEGIDLGQDIQAVSSMRATPRTWPSMRRSRLSSLGLLSLVKDDASVPLNGPVRGHPNG
jgi:hypothetical protein